jgi:hypothetical protein
MRGEMEGSMGKYRYMYMGNLYIGVAYYAGIDN